MKKKIFFITLITCILILFCANSVFGIERINTNSIKVDVGSFEDYDSGSSSGSDYSYSGSSYSGGSSYSSSGDGLYLILFVIDHPILSIIILIIVFIVLKLYKKYTSSLPKNPSSQYTVTNANLQMVNNDESVCHEIKEKDPDFNIDEFKSFAKTVFIKLQNAWTARDWESVRVFESDTLFEQHKSQLQGYINNNQINVMDRIMVNDAHLYSFAQIDGQDTLTIDLKTRMSDYIIDANTKEVVRGDPKRENYHIYRLTFTRNLDDKTPKDGKVVTTTNCPNCGAPTEITSSGRCPYCNSVITTKHYGWVLSNLERPQ